MNANLSNLTSSPTVKDYDLRERALQLCSHYLGGSWSKISPNDMSFTPISGGMSNLLFCCSLPDTIQLESNAEPTQVVLRLYGDQSRSSDMSIQVEIFKLLSHKELGPKLFGDFEDGRLEEFIPANSLTSQELMDADIASVIAKKIATVHSLDVPISKGRTWLQGVFSEWQEFIAKQLKVPAFDEGVRQSTKDIAKELLSIDFSEEIKFLRHVLDQSNSPIVFSHNDLHQGNILLAKHSKRRSTLEKRVILIDFEYCSYNYRGYDIANHFCEWCFEYDSPEYPHFQFFEERFPSKEVQREFVRNYSEQRKHLANHSKKLTSILSSSSANGASNGGSHTSKKRQLSNGINGVLNGHSNGISKQILEDLKEEALLNEVKPFFMVASFLWTLWCIKSAHSSTIKFGYWEHAMTRWRLYQKFKSSYITDVKTMKITNDVSIE